MSQTAMTSAKRSRPQATRGYGRSQRRMYQAPNPTVSHVEPAKAPTQQQQQQAQAQSVALQQPWMCLVCTLENSAADTCCMGCSSPRPQVTRPLTPAHDHCKSMISGVELECTTAATTSRGTDCSCRPISAKDSRGCCIVWFACQKVISASNAVSSCGEHSTRGRRARHARVSSEVSLSATLIAHSHRFTRNFTYVDTDNIA